MYSPWAIQRIEAPNPDITFAIPKKVITTFFYMNQLLLSGSSLNLLCLYAGRILIITKSEKKTAPMLKVNMSPSFWLNDGPNTLPIIYDKYRIPRIMNPRLSSPWDFKTWVRIFWQQAKGVYIQKNRKLTATAFQKFRYF